MLNTEMLAEFIELDAKKKAHEGDLKKIKDQIAIIEHILREQMTVDSLQKITSNNRTVYIGKRIYADIEDKEAAIEALKAAGLDDYVKPTYNLKSLAAYIKEKLDHGEALPPEFEGVIGVGTKYNLRSVKG